MIKYDEFLAFNLPMDYYAVEGLNDAGEPYFHVSYGKSVNDDGEDK